MTVARYPPNTDFFKIKALAGIAYELSSIADGIAVVEAARNGDIKGVVIAGVGFVPAAKIGKILGNGVEAAIGTLRAGDEKAKEALTQIRINSIAGKEFEDAVIAAHPNNKNKALFSVKLPGGKVAHTIPDVVCNTGICEIKNVINLSNSPQLRAQVELANQRGVPFNLIVSNRNQTISKKLRDAVSDTGGSIKRFDADTGVLKVLK